jgi:hypothetical protein
MYENEPASLHFKPLLIRFYCLFCTCRYQQLRQNVIDAGLDINKLDTPTTINSIILGSASTGGTAGSGGVLLDTPDDHRPIKSATAATPAMATATAFTPNSVSKPTTPLAATATTASAAPAKATPSTFWLLILLRRVIACHVTVM